MVKGCKIILYLNLSHTHITDASLRTISKWVGYFIHRHVYTDHHYVSTPRISLMPPYKQSQSQNPTRRRLPLDHLKFKPSPYASNLKVRTPHKDSFYCAKTSPFKSSQIYLCAKIPYFKPTWSTQIQLPGIGNTDSSSLINFEIMCMVTSIDLGSKKNTVINISIWFSLLCIFLVFV